LFEEQDRSLWSQELIDKGHHFLVQACTGEEISNYHLEAGIAYWHTAPVHAEKWPHILQLYNQLMLIEYSPITALNRAFALAKVYGNEAGIKEAEALQLKDHSHWHALLGYLYSHPDHTKAMHHGKE